MRCPACQHEAFETANVCLQCNFSLAGLEKIMGFAPHLKTDVTDMAGHLKGREIKALRQAIFHLQRRFPQVRCAVVVSVTPESVTLPLYVFWLFNKGGLSSAVERGGANRLVLIVHDPEADKLACMIGYGLEPFVSEDRMADCLQAALSGISAGETGKGLEACIARFDAHLAEVAASIERGFGLGVEYEHLEQLTEGGDAPALAY